MNRCICWLVTGVVLGVVIARTDAASEVPPLKPVELITDPAEIEAAKTAEASVDASSARAVGWAIRGLLNSDYLPSLVMFEEHRDAAIPRLKKVIELAGDTPVPASIAASHMLHALGEPGYEPQVLPSLQDDSAAERLIGLQLLQSVDDMNTPLEPTVAAKVLSLFDDPDAEVRLTAAHVAGARKLPEFGDKLQAAVRAGRLKPQDVAHWLAEVSDDPSMFDRVADATFADAVRQIEGGEWLDVTYLSAFLRNPEPAVAEHARMRLRQMLRRISPGVRRDQTFSTLLEVAATEADVDLLMDVFHHAPQRWSREAAFRGLARVRPGDAHSLATEAFDRAPHAATKVLLEHATEADTPRILRIVGALDSDDWTIDTVALLIAKGGEVGRKLVRDRLDELDPYLQTAAKWKLEGLSLETAINEFHQAGIISVPPQELLKPLDDRSDAAIEEDYIEPAMSLEDALEQANVLMWWDAEAGQMPVGHDDLLTAMAAASNDYFRPRHISEKWLQRDGDEMDAPYRVQFIHHDKLFRVEARNFGAWYDVEAVIAAANTAMEHTGRPERFIPLNGGDQYAMILFADPKALAPLAKKYGLQLDATADGARQRGLAFEAKVLDSMDAKEPEP